MAKKHEYILNHGKGTSKIEMQVYIWHNITKV